MNRKVHVRFWRQVGEGDLPRLASVVVLSQGSVVQPFQYTGEQRDAETGFSYLRARMYDAQAGRFVQRDVLGGITDDPVTLQRYAYAHNNPIVLIDPSGLAVPWKKNWVLADPIAFAAMTSMNPLGAGVAVAAAVVTRVSPQVSQQIGAAGERLAGIVKNTTMITGASGKLRIPDFLDPIAKVIGDVKNVKYLEYRSQLRDFVQYARDHDYSMELIVRADGGTRLTAPIQKLVDEGVIVLKETIPWP